MRAADIVRRIWGDTPLANPANSANAERYSQDSQHSHPPMNGNSVQSFARFATFAGGGARQLLPDLLRQHGGFPGIDWHGLALIDATTSALWIVQRPDGRLTTLATVDPIPKPLSYRNAWPARFTTPEPVEDAAPAAAQAAQAVQKARQSCWDCRHLDTHPRPTCALRHPVGWQTAQTRTYPRRFDATDCGDFAP